MSGGACPNLVIGRGVPTCGMTSLPGLRFLYYKFLCVFVVIGFPNLCPLTRHLPSPRNPPENNVADGRCQAVRIDLTVKRDTGEAHLFNTAQDDLAGQLNGNVVPDLLVGTPSSRMSSTVLLYILTRS